jgi:hypothetical protein
MRRTAGYAAWRSDGRGGERDMGHHLGAAAGAGSPVFGNRHVGSEGGGHQRRCCYKDVNAAQRVPCATRGQPNSSASKEGRPESADGRMPAPFAGGLFSLVEQAKNAQCTYSWGPHRRSSTSHHALLRMRRATALAGHDGQHNGNHADTARMVQSCEKRQGEQSYVGQKNKQMTGWEPVTG